ncbi:MAG: cytochrome c [Sulfuricellaceae bacterium]|nr:cytochrome c [Sulfuricellaceae bacterium]
MRPLFFAASVLFAAQAAADVTPLRQKELARQQELVRLVRHDCGSCHGLTLLGGLGPALLPANLRDKPKESLVATILFGRPGTPMPPWREFVTEAEAEWIVERLLQDFPNEP